MEKTRLARTYHVCTCTLMLLALPGQHVLIARKPGDFPVTEPVSLIPGKQTRVVPRTRRSQPTGRELELDITPLVSGDTAGISARIQF